VDGSVVPVDLVGRRDRVIRGAAVLVGALVLTSACSRQPEPRLIDETGLVTEYRFSTTPDNDLAIDYREIEVAGTGAIAVAPPPGWDIRVVWPAGHCLLSPTVRVTGTPEQVTTIRVDYGPEVGLGACPEELLIFGV